MTKDQRRRERREDSIIAKIAVPLLVGVLLALAVGGTSPWWWSVVFPAPSPMIGQHSPLPVTAPPADETATAETGVPSSVADSPTPETSPSPPPTEPPTFLERLQGEWAFDTWQERPGPVTLNFEPLSGSLHVDAFGHAYWDLDLDDGGPPPPITPGLRCTGVVDAATETLASWTGSLDVDGDDVITTERDWTSNLRSLPGDAHVAFCGAAGPFAKLFVYDTDRSDYTMTIATAADAAGTLLLTMQNAAGTFTWKKAG